MAGRLQDSLTEMLDQYDARQRADSARERKGKEDDARFIARFAELRRDVIRPVFDAAAALLEARGHACSITEEEFSRDVGGQAIEASISLRIDPAGMKAPQPSDEHARTMSIITRHYNRTIWVNAGKPMGAGGMAGSKGAYPLERIDANFVEEELIKLVGSVLAG
jgi:hypothetical protein